MKKIRLRKTRLVGFLARAFGFLLKSHLFTVWVVLCGLGVWVGTQARPERGAIPYEELFENLRVTSYREAPSDSMARFVVDLSARGRAFRQYDIEARRFVAPARSQNYWRSISGTRYAPLKVRGHVNRGFWLELPGPSTKSLLPEQFDELYETTLGFVKPTKVLTGVLGILSGYSVGYRLATWGTSLSNPSVQERVLAVPGIGRAVAREAWRRVALEPVMVFAEDDAGRFATINGRQRLYTNFFKLAVNDSDGFVPYEVARLESAGLVRESRAMQAFARAVRHAAQDTCDLSNADFNAIEEWAGLLDRRGHWAYGAVPAPREERLRYFGTLAWYGLAPKAPDERRIWVGPRLLVRNGDMEGFVPDETPLNRVACPVAWREWLGGEGTSLSAHAWTAQWMGDARQFAPVVNFCMGVARAVRGGEKASREDEDDRDLAEELREGDPQFVTPAPTPSPIPASDLNRVARSEAAASDTTRAPRAVAQLPDSTPHAASIATDSIGGDPARTASDPKFIRANIGGLDK